jgi:Lytic polysaccharide mono-oxygenase, cellulose-degrading
MSPVPCAISTAGFALVLAAVCLTVDAHGFVSQPRQRGSLRSQRSLVPQVLDPTAPIDYCPHCQNCGGVGGVRKGGPWKMYAPFEYARGGITMCGDPVGKNDHTSKGQYANPASMPFAATYKPGSVANFECTSNQSHASVFLVSFLFRRSYQLDHLSDHG